MDDFFNAVDEAVEEYHADYKPEIERVIREKKEKLEKTRLENLEKLMTDMKMSKGKEVDMNAKSGKSLFGIQPSSNSVN